MGESANPWALLRRGSRTRGAGDGIKPRVSPRTRGGNSTATRTREAGDGIKPRVSPRTRGRYGGGAPEPAERVTE